MSRSFKLLHTFLLVAPVLIGQPLHAGLWEPSEASLYVDVNLGYSSIEPRTRCDCYQVTDTNDGGIHLGLGYDVSSRLAAELHYADLGEATISDASGNKAGSVGYQDAGISAIGYLFARNSQSASRGSSPYLRIGAGYMKNDTQLSHKREDNTHLVIGMGMEFALGNGLSARTEITAYDADAKMFTFGLMKRFGFNRKPYTPVAQKTRTSSLRNPGGSAPEPENSDSTALFSLQLPTLYFAQSSAELTPEDRRHLRRLASAINRFYKLHVLVKGYADDPGDSNANLLLSLKRAMQVKKQLIDFGVPGSHLDAQGLGRPGHSKSGMQPAENRKVEFDFFR